MSDDGLIQAVEEFLALAKALSLSMAEQRTLLDVTAADMAALTDSPAAAAAMDAEKLQRLATNAIPVLRRMLAASP